MALRELRDLAFFPLQAIPRSGARALVIGGVHPGPGRPETATTAR